MKQWIIGVIVLLGLLLSSCGVPQNADITTSNAETARNGQWGVYEGDLISADTAQLPILEIEEAENRGICIFDSVYAPIPADKLELSTVSGWRITLDAFTAAGITHDGNIVYSPSSMHPLVICLKNTASGQLDCYLRGDILDNFPNIISGEDFDLYVGNERISCNQRLQYVWEAHTTQAKMDKAYGVLDGDWEFHCINFVSKECPALRYEFKYVIINGMIYVENINMNHLVSVPAF